MFLFFLLVFFGSPFGLLCSLPSPGPLYYMHVENWDYSGRGKKGPGKENKTWVHDTTGLREE